MMEGSIDLASSNIAILGLGLMGGSLAMALEGGCKTRLAYDSNPSNLELALREHIIERASMDPREILPDADLVILATPVLAIIDLIRRLPDWHPGNPVVIDLGSTKTNICQVLDELPPRFDPLGGHPMCGKSMHGLDNADADLFQKAIFAFTPLRRTSERARILAAQLAHRIGALPVWLDPQVHDRWAAATSHLPYLLSCVLALATPLDAAPMVGPGFRSSSRLAASSLNMMEDILRTNQENVLQSLAHFRDELGRLEELLTREDYPNLLLALERAADNHRLLVETPLKGIKH